MNSAGLAPCPLHRDAHARGFTLRAAARFPRYQGAKGLRRIDSVDPRTQALPYGLSRQRLHHPSRMAHMKVVFHQYSPTKHQMELIHRASLKAIADRGEISRETYSRELIALANEFDRPNTEWLLDHIRLGAESVNSGRVPVEGTTVTQLEAERNWFIDERPFYNVYPVLLPLIESTKLDAHVANDLDFPTEVICMCFPVGNEPFGIRSVLARRIDKYIAIIVQTAFIPAVEKAAMGAPDKPDPRCVGMLNFLFVCSNAEQSKTLEDDVNAIGERITNPRSGTTSWEYTEAERKLAVDALVFSVRAVLILALLADGSDLISPIILKEDEHRTNPLNPADWAIQRAIKRGRKGFCLGRRLQEVYEEEGRSPHYRRPHLALYHVGKGRQEKKLVLRDGCIVMPRELTDVPTDYLGPEVQSDIPPADAVARGYRAPLPNRVRFLVLERDQHRCVMCGRTARDGITLEVDHRTAVASGGTNELDNLQTLCNICNSGKSDLPTTLQRA